MKKVLVAFILIIMIISVSGCGTNKVDNNNNNDNDNELKDIYFEVLNGKRKYIDSEGNSLSFTDNYLSKFKEYDKNIEISYTMVDVSNKIDKKNIEEMIVLVEANDGFYLVLSYDKEDNKVYGLEENYRTMTSIKKDGLFMASSGANDTLIGQFNIKERIIVGLTVGSSDGYFIDSKKVSEKEYNDYLDEFNKKENVKFTKYKTIKGKNNEDITNKTITNKTTADNYYVGTYYMVLTDGSLAEDGTGTIILNNDMSCTYIYGQSNMGCTSYSVNDHLITLKLSESDDTSFTLDSDNKLLISSNNEKYMKQ